MYDKNGSDLFVTFFVMFIVCLFAKIRGKTLLFDQRDNFGVEFTVSTHCGAYLFIYDV